MCFDILTLFPDMVNTVLNESIIGRAQKAGLLEVHCHQIRDFSENKHRNVDDTPYGGGVGMVMAAPPIYNCYRSVADTLDPTLSRRTIYLSPRGRVFNQDIARELATYDQLTLLCGHYEGVDQRVLDEIVDMEISIGDFVLTGGEIAAMAVVDATARMIPGVLSSEMSFSDESHFDGLLEYPQYTRPSVWHGREVPEVLQNGNHKLIEEWKRKNAIENTFKKRRGMLRGAKLTQKEKKIVEELKKENLKK